MAILKNELCKLFTKKTVLILLLLIVINPLLQLYTIKNPGEDFYTLTDYSALYREVSGYDADEIPAVLEKREADASSYGEFNLCRRVREEVKACLSYDEYLRSVDEKAAEIAIMHRFVDDGGYALKNAEKTSGVYRKLKGTVPKVQDPMPLLNITDNDLTDWLAVIMIFIISLNLVFYEKNEDQLSLLRTAADGRRKLMAAKTAAMFISVLLVLVSLYAVNAAVGRCLFGPMELGSPIQSIYQYRTSPFSISIGQYLGLWFPAKVLTCFLLGIFFMLTGAVFGSIIFVFAVSAVTVLAEILLFTKIPGTHFLALLRYLNITYGIRTGGMFSDYVNLNLFGTPVNTLVLYWGLWIVLTALILWAVVNYLEATHEAKAMRVRKRSLLGFLESHTSLFFHEAHKLLLPGKCLIVLILFCIFAVWWNPAERIRFDSVDELYYKEYMDRFQGPLDSERWKMLGAEQAKYEKITNEINSAYEEGKSLLYLSVVYGEDLDRQKAFENVMTHAQYLLNVKDGELFFDKGYDILTNEQNRANRDVMQAFVYVIMLIAMAFGIYGLDYRNSEVRILRSTYLGRGRLRCVKCFLGFLCVLAAFSLTYLLFTRNILKAYGTVGIHASAASVENLAKVPQNLSVLQYLLLIMLMRFIAGLLIAAAVALLFKVLRNGISVIIACVLIFLIPLLLVSLHVPNAQYVLFNPMLLGNVFV